MSIVIIFLTHCRCTLNLNDEPIIRKSDNIRTAIMCGDSFISCSLQTTRVRGEFVVFRTVMIGIIFISYSINNVTLE